MAQVCDGDAAAAPTARVAQGRELFGQQSQVGRGLEGEGRVGGPAERFEDVPVERRGMSGRVADAGRKAFADDRAQSLIPVGNGARPRRAPKVSGLGDLCGEASQAGQQGQS